MDPALITAAVTASQTSGSGLEGLIVTLLIIVVGGLGKTLFDGHQRDKRDAKNGYARKDDIDKVLAKLDENARDSRAGDAELHVRLDGLKEEMREDRRRIAETEGDIKVLMDRSESGRCK